MTDQAQTELKPCPEFDEWFDQHYPDTLQLKKMWRGLARDVWDAAWNTRPSPWSADMDAAPRNMNPDGTLGVIGIYEYGGDRWSAHHIWWNPEEEEWNDIHGDQIVRPSFWVGLPPKQLPQPPEESE